MVECEVSGSSAPQHHDGVPVQALVASPDSKWAATGSLESTITLWDTVDGAITQRWVAHGSKPVTSLAFSPDSRCLVSGGDDGRAAIWDLTGTRSACRAAALEPEGHAAAAAVSVLACAWSPAGDTIATGSEDGTARLWDAHTFRQRGLLQLQGAVVCLEFSPDGLWLACGSRRGECCIVNAVSGALHRSLWNSPSDDPGRQACDTVAAFDATSGRMRLATAPSGSSAGISVVDVETGSVLLHLGGKMGELMRMHDVSFSPDGTLVLGVSVTLKKAVYIWDASTGVELVQLRRPAEVIQKARFSPCGGYIASVAGDRTVRLWRTSDGSCVAKLSEHKEAAELVAFSPDGQTLSSGARDGTVIIRQMRGIIPMEQDSGQFSIAHRTSVVDPIPHTSPLPDRDNRAWLSSDDAVDPAGLRRMQERESAAADNTPTSVTLLSSAAPVDRRGRLPPYEA